MIINCFRCKKEIDTPGNTNADYVIADDMVVKEPRETFFALKHNQATLAKKARMAETKPTIDPETKETYMKPKYPNLQIDDSEYDAVEIPGIKASKAIGEDLIKVVVELREKDIQKTGIICPDCYRPMDFVIWGVHKGK